MKKNRISIIFFVSVCLLLVLSCSISFTPPDEGKSSESTAEESSLKPSGNDSESSEPIQANFPSGSDFTYINWKCEEEHAPAELPVGIGYKWAAKTAQQVQDYLDAVTHQVEINGSPYASPPIFSEITENEKGYFYTQVYIYFGDLKPGKYEFKTVGSFTEKVFDGEYWSGPGTEHPTFEGSCTLIVEANGGQLAVEPQPQEQGDNNKQSAPLSDGSGVVIDYVPEALKQDPPLTFTFFPESGLPTSEVMLYLSRAADVDVYYDGKIIPKIVVGGGKELHVLIPSNAKSAYFELKGDGISVRADKKFSIDSSFTIGGVTLSFGPTTDLAVTDLYPDNMPKGEVFARITCHGPESLENYPVELVCQARLDPRPAIGDINTKKEIKLSIKPGETKIIATGIHTETDAFKYTITCTVNGVVDPNKNNNSYTEVFP